jgi:hypothetical protein
LSYTRPAERAGRRPRNPLVFAGSGVPPLHPISSPPPVLLAILLLPRLPVVAARDENSPRKACSCAEERMNELAKKPSDDSTSSGLHVVFYDPLAQQETPSHAAHTRLPKLASAPRRKQGERANSRSIRDDAVHQVIGDLAVLAATRLATSCSGSRPLH